jgi:hypothetical protein
MIRRNRAIYHLQFAPQGHSFSGSTARREAAMMLKKASLSCSSEWFWEAKFAVFHDLIEP